MTVEPSSPPEAAPDEVPAVLSYVGRPSTEARIRVLRRDRRQRLARALRTLAVCWGLAVVCVLVPLLHFVLVPGFLIAGPFMALGAFRESVMVLEARGDCPGCGVSQVFPVRMAARPRIPLRCERCRRQVVLEPDPSVLEPAGKSRA